MGDRRDLYGGEVGSSVRHGGFAAWERERVEALKERDELREARKRIRELEAAVADAHIDHCPEKACFHVACERMGVDPEDC